MQKFYYGPDRESQLRVETHGPTGARSDYLDSDQAVIGDWSGRVFNPLSGPCLAILQWNYSFISNFVRKFFDLTAA